jgi:NAD(P)-dependent dehydrogenase (short-subunit alcohol dehydrogenase family)
MPAALVTGASRRAGIAAAVVDVLRRDGWSVATSGWRAYDASESWGSEPQEAEEIGGGAFIEVDLNDPPRAGAGTPCCRGGHWAANGAYRRSYRVATGRSSLLALEP